MLLAAGLGIGVTVVLAAADAGMNVIPPIQRCDYKFPKWFGCILANHENLAGGLIASAAAIFSGYIAWIAIKNQILAARNTDFRRNE